MAQLYENTPDELLKEHSSRLSWTVRISAAVLGALLLVFFIVVLRNLSTINSQVEYVAESPYPISVASGHIETDLVHLQTFIQNEASYQLGANSDSEQEEERELNEILADLNVQLDIIKGAARPGDLEVERMERLLMLLESRSAVFFSMTWHGDKSREKYEDVTTYVESYIEPVLNIMLETNNQALEATSERVKTMYSEVNTSVSVLFSFAIMMSIAVIAVSIILLIVIYVRGNFEKSLRASLADALEASKSANKAKSAFMANMSHDIRTPMNAIVGLTQIAVENIGDTPKVEQCLTRIGTSSQHLLSLINDVLDMNKIESGRVTLSKGVFSLSVLTEEIDALFQSQPDNMRRQSEVVVENLFADLLVGDAMRMRQILLNLVSNALKYTNEGDLTRLTVKENRTANKNVANVVFIVEDTGIGMQKEFIEHIFEPFERENNDFTIFTEGTGLGMAITKNLVDLMGGTIKVESDLGIGTTVTLSIDFEIAPEGDAADNRGYSMKLANEIRDFERENSDIAKDDAVIEEGGKSPESDERPKEGALKEGDAPDKKEGPSGSSPEKKHKLSVTGNVLVVEDNDINMEIAKQLIGSRGATVDEAYDGLEAVKKIEESGDGAYDLIFMDLQMPHMNGIEATKAIREFQEGNGLIKTPIVAMTANAFDSDKETALAAGMNDFMAKPINIRQLEEVLKEHLS